MRAIPLACAAVTRVVRVFLRWPRWFWPRRETGVCYLWR
jgi:hypothetical protein